MISNKCMYALKAVLELSKRTGQGPVTIGDIASAQGIPARFLEAILRELKQGGVTDSIRGKDGGYLLARTPREISVGTIIELMEGPLLGPTTDQEPTEVFSEIWKQAQDCIGKVLGQTTYDKIVEREAELRGHFVSDYAI